MQPFYIYPFEIPPEDSSPLLSFLSLLYMPARDDHTAPAFTSSIHPGDDHPPWQGGGGTWKDLHLQPGTLHVLAFWNEQKGLNKWETKQVGWRKRKKESGNHFLLSVYIQSQLWSLDGVQTQSSVIGLHTPGPDIPGTDWGRMSTGELSLFDLLKWFLLFTVIALLRSGSFPLSLSLRHWMETQILNVNHGAHQQIRSHSENLSTNKR